MFTFPEQLPGPARFGKGLSVVELPECASESCGDKASRFTDDPTLIGDDLRSLLREIRNCYHLYDHRNLSEEWDLEAAYDEWQAFGCTEWFQPKTEVARNVFEALANWSARFQRAARIAISKTIPEISPPLDLNSVAALSRCLAGSWCERTGHELLTLHGTLTENLENFVRAVDTWVFRTNPAPAENDANVPAGWEKSCAGVAGKVAKYYQDVSAVVTDWNALLERFDETHSLRGGMTSWYMDYAPELRPPAEEKLNYVRLEGCGNLAGHTLSNSIEEFTRALHRVREYQPSTRLQRVDIELLEEWAVQIEFLDGFLGKSEELVGLTSRVKKAFKAFAEDIACQLAIVAVSRPTTVAATELPPATKRKDATGFDLELKTDISPGIVAQQGAKQKLTLNAHMTHLLEKHKDACQLWSVEQWQLELTPTWGKTPSKGGIHGTNVWKWLMSLREETRNALQEKQTMKDENGKRRSTTY